MKKVIVCAILFSITVVSFSQDVNPIPLTKKEAYMEKSKNQKTAAWILLGALPVLTGAGALVGNKAERFEDGKLAQGGFLITLGILSGIGSIPLFSASSRNKTKAMYATTNFKIESTQTIQQHGIGYIGIPAIAVKIKLR